MINILANPNPRRVDALDALRGLAILAMLLSGLVPRGELPAWMYHAQIPPPDHHFDPTVAGLTWVDLVFPFFLFALGAAIPFALSSRIARGESVLRLVGHAVLRGFLLLAFAVYIPHVDPWQMAATPTVGTWLLALLAFALMFPALARLPREWSRPRVRLTRAVGWGGAIALVAGVWYVGTGRLTSDWTSVAGVIANLNRIAERSDIIIVVLANVAVWASLIWLASHHNVPARLAVMLALLGLRLAHQEPGWVKTLWEFHPVPRLYQLYFAQYLLIVLPGTIAGDLMRAWQRSAPAVDEPSTLSKGRLVGLVCVCGALVVFTLCGLQGRWLPWATPAGVAVLLVAAHLLTRRPSTPQGELLCRLVRWGTVWLIIGLVFEPYEGGIKKDHATVSYYFVTSGLACCTLVLLQVMIEELRVRRGFGLLIANGQNPMIAYLGIRNIIPPLLVPTGLNALLERLTPTAWLGVLRGVAKTALLAWIVKQFSRRRIYWRT